MYLEKIDQNEFIVEKQLLTERVFEILKKRIVNKEYPAGYRLKEASLAKEFNVSTITIRGTFRILWSIGFIDLIPYKGAEVADLSNIKRAQSIIETRIMIESFVIEKAIKNINSELIDELKEYLDEYKNTDESNLIKLSQIDYYFHRAIVKTSHNSYILNIFDNINFQTPSNEEFKDFESHELIYKSIISKDIKRAKAAIINHLTRKDPDIAKM